MSGERGTPPPSAALLAAVADAKPVRTRRPLRALLALALVWAATAALFLVLEPMRRDWPFLPHAWWGLVLAAWAAGALAPLALALLPRRGRVLPDGGRAALAALATAAALLLVAFALTPAAPPHTRIPPDTATLLRSVRHCLSFGLLVALVPMATGLIALRPLLLVHGARLLAAVGAAAGALGGLVLHLICPMGGAWHVGLAHGGAVVVAAAIGAVGGTLLGRRAP